MPTDQEDTRQADDPHVDGWLRAMQMAYTLAYSTRVDELRGERRKAFNDQGLHPYSMNIGMAFAYEELEPVLALAGFNPHALRREAEQEAWLAVQREMVAAKTEQIKAMADQLHDSAMRALIRAGLSPEEAEGLLADAAENPTEYTITGDE